MKNSPFKSALFWVLAATILSGILIFINRILTGDAFTFEEAQHALYSMWLTRDITALDLNAFFYDTSRQMLWPFLHSWLGAFFSLFFGVSYVSARSLNLIFFLLTVVLIYNFSKQVCGKSGEKIGLLAVLLTLTSPLMITYASANMLESLGALLFITAAYIYTNCETHKVTIEYLLLAFVIGLSIYTNYLYAYLILPAFLVGTVVKLSPLTIEAIHLRRKGEKEAMHFIWWAYRKVIVAAVLVLFCAVWFFGSFSRKIQLLYISIFKYSGGTAVTSFWDGLLYYPKVIVQQLSFSPHLGLLILISLFLPFVARRYRWLDKLYTYIWTILLLLILTVPTKAPQLLYIIVPFILIVFSAAVFYFVDLISKRNKKLAGVLLLLVFLPSIISLPTLYQLYFPAKPLTNMIRVMDYFKTTMPEGSDFAIQVNLDRLHAEGIKYHFQDWQGKVIVDSVDDERELFDSADYFLSIEIDQTGPYAAEKDNESLFRWNELLRANEVANKLRLHAVARFGDAGLTANIFKKNR